MEIIIVILSAFILGVVAFYFFEKKKWEKTHRQDRTMIEEEKKMIITLGEKIETYREDLEEAERNEKAAIEKVLLWEKQILDFEIETLNKKEELEYIAARAGLNKMDDGILFRMIQNKATFSRTLLSNWLPYGMQLGKLALIEEIKTKKETD